MWVCNCMSVFMSSILAHLLSIICFQTYESFFNWYVNLNSLMRTIKHVKILNMCSFNDFTFAIHEYFVFYVLTIRHDKIERNNLSDAKSYAIIEVLDIESRYFWFRWNLFWCVLFSKIGFIGISSADNDWQTRRRSVFRWELNRMYWSLSIFNDYFQQPKPSTSELLLWSNHLKLVKKHRRFKSFLTK